MYAIIELDKEMIHFLMEAKNHDETFEEIKELVFTQKKKKQDYSLAESFNLLLKFHEIKNNAINKALAKQKLNFPEGFVIERLIYTKFKEEEMTVEEHIKKITLSCCNNRAEKRIKEKKFISLYKKFVNIFFDK